MCPTVGWHWNNAGAGFGGGIALYNSGSTLVENNIIQGNVAGTWGAGMRTYGDTSGTDSTAVYDKQ